MTNGTTQGLFIVLAIVIFGIFVLISYMLYQDKMKTGLTAIMCDAMTITSKNTGFELSDKDCTATFPNGEENEDSNNSEIPTGLQYYKIRDANEQRSESEVWVLIEHEDSENVRIIDSGDSDGFTPETFGANLDGIIYFPNKIENWNITHIDKKSFEQAKFSEIMKLPDELLILDDYSLKQSVFSGEAKFPENLEIIGIEALRDSRFTGGLDTLPNVREIREDALKESEFTDSDLSKLGKNSEEGLILADGALGKYKPTGILKLPDNITQLGSVNTDNNNNNNDSDRQTNVFDTSEITGIDFSNVPDLKIIGDNVFKDSKITGALTIPSTVEAIGNNAFENSNISKLELHEGSKLKEIGKNAFKESNITTLDLSKAQELENIDDGAFENSELRGILFLPNSIKRIGDRSFYTARFTNSNWKTPEKLEYIGDSAFFNSMFSLNLFLDNSKNLTYIGDRSFILSFRQGVGLNNATGLLQNPRYSSMKYKIHMPDSVEYIGNSAFQEAHFTGEFKIPKNTKYIGNSAFRFSFAEYSISKVFAFTSTLGGYTTNYYNHSYSQQPNFYFNENIEHIGRDAFKSAHFKDSSNVIPRKLRTIGKNAFQYSFGTNTKLPRGVFAIEQIYHYYSTISAEYNKQQIKVGQALQSHDLENVLVVD